MLSNSSKYAIKAVLFLALNTNDNKKVMVKDISEPINVPQAYIAKLLQELSRKQIISSTRGPKGGFYFDSIMRQKPIDDDKLNYEDNLEEFSAISAEELEYFSKEVNHYYENTDSAIAITVGGTAFGDIALVPAPFLKEPKGIRDVTEWYMSIALRADYIMKVFEAQAEIAIENLKATYKAVGDKVQIVFMSGTDFGSQNAPMISEATYRQMFFPYQKKLNDWVHKNTPWKTFMIKKHL